MKRKLINLLFGLIVVISIAGCKNKGISVLDEQTPTQSIQPEVTEQTAVTNTYQPEENYVIEAQTYEKDLVKLIYPKIINLSNKTLEEQCNEILESYAMGDIQNFGTEDTYELAYEVTTQTKDMISIILRGYINFKQSAHPSVVVYTLNVDLTKGKIIRLANVKDVNELAKILYSKKGYKICDSDGNEVEDEWKSSVWDFLSQYTEESLADELRTYDVDSKEDIGTLGYSYYKDDHLYICMSVPHVMGDVIIFMME